jgi:hypothetical protein
LAVQLASVDIEVILTNASNTLTITTSNRIIVECVVLTIVAEASRIEYADTSLYRLILFELPTLECMYCRECRITVVSDLIAQIHLIIVDSVDETICVSRAEKYDQVVCITELIRADELVCSSV